MDGEEYYRKTVIPETVTLFKQANSQLVIDADLLERMTQALIQIIEYIDTGYASEAAAQQTLPIIMEGLQLIQRIDQNAPGASEFGAAFLYFRTQWSAHFGPQLFTSLIAKYDFVTPYRDMLRVFTSIAADGSYASFKYASIFLYLLVNQWFADGQPIPTDVGIEVLNAAMKHMYDIVSQLEKHTGEVDARLLNRIDGVRGVVDSVRSRRLVNNRTPNEDALHILRRYAKAVAFILDRMRKTGRGSGTHGRLNSSDCSVASGDLMRTLVKGQFTSSSIEPAEGGASAE